MRGERALSRSVQGEYIELMRSETINMEKKQI